MNYKKIIIMGTRSLVDRPQATLAFGNDNCIVIPMIVVDKLESLSHDYTEKGKNAKKILDYLDSFSIKELLSDEGVRQKNGSILRLENGQNLPKVSCSLPEQLNVVDKKRLEIALGLKQLTNKPVIMVTTNTALRIKAKSLGIKAQAIQDNIFPSLEEQYKGRVDCKASKANIDKFYNGGSLKPKDIYQNSKIEWYPNLFLKISCLENPKIGVIGRFDGEKIVHLNFANEHPYGIETKKVGQIMALEALMASPESAPLVVIKGGAGTGKTYMSMAAALEQTIRNSVYERILVTTPTEHTKDLGYLPGDLQKKMNPRLGGILDNLNLILKKDKKKKSQRENSSYHHKFTQEPDSDDDKSGFLEFIESQPAAHLFADGIIEIQLIAYLRGRSITNTIFVVDETQNIHPDDIKSIVTRASEGSKFIFLGDPTQIDNPDLNERYNGLVYLSEKMKDSPMAWIISMKDEESVRSPLSRYSATVL